MTTLTLVDQMAQARHASDALFAILTPEALYQRPIAERHRLIFYVGHLEAFDRNLLAGGRHSQRSDFDRLFAFGIDPTQGDLPTDSPQDWPGLAEVQEYCRATRADLDPMLADCPPQKLQTALEHRWMHCETLAYLLHRLPYSSKQPPNGRKAISQESALPFQWCSIPCGTVQLGQKPNQGFGWDNEFEATQVEVPAFEIQSMPVTNGQFLEFVQAGGYAQMDHWKDSDWQWIQREGITHPGFWIPAGDGSWQYRGMFEAVPLPQALPVYVSHAEASAYARWKGRTLPSEAQYQRAAWGGGSLDLSQANLDARHWDPLPVGSDPVGVSAFGVHEMVGNGWEWTSTPFGPLPGFKAFDFYPGYSADFFDQKHYVMKGASARTSICLTRPSFRNWFQPHYPHVYATFRCQRS